VTFTAQLRDIPCHVFLGRFLIHNFKKCRACKAPVKGNRFYCDQTECQRKASAERKARSRAGKVPEVAVQAVEDKGPATPAQVLDSPATAPWGAHFDTLADLWMWSLHAGRDPFGRDLFLVLCEASDADPHRYPTMNSYNMNWRQVLDVNAQRTGVRK
jgi:hypothetical protein